MGEWTDLRWFLVLNGIADAWMWAVDADRWQLRFGHPAMGTMGILPMPGEPVATLSDALWLADVLAFDHDAPVGVSPAWEGEWPDMNPKDTRAVPASQPVHPFDDQLLHWYWDHLNAAYGAAAELRFNDSYVLRYDPDDIHAPSTRFSERFRGREEIVSLYAMAARQADLLSEYLCLYRVLEAVDGGNGKRFAATTLDRLADHDFGQLMVVEPHETYEDGTNAFEVYRERALRELDDLQAADVPAYLYGIRNSLAHGKKDVLVPRAGDQFVAAVRALPIVKLLARIAVEP